MQQPTIIVVNLKDITVDDRLQMRVSTDLDTIEEYADNLKSLPPVKLIREGEVQWLWDGHLRYAAHKKAKVHEIKAEVTEGTFIDALAAAAGANFSHGLRRSDEDKRRAVASLFKEKTWAGRSDRVIAETCKVSHPFVSKIRKELGLDADGTREARNGAHHPATSGPMCDRCKRVGPVPGCGVCRDLKEGKPVSANPEDDKAVIVDAFGKEIPRRCRAAYFDPWMQSTIDLLAVVEEKIRAARPADGMNKRKAHFPFVNSKDVIDGLGMVMNNLDQIINHLKDNRPAAVCLKCDGKGCDACKASGLVPRKVREKQRPPKK
jgi:hypothetical protein